MCCTTPGIDATGSGASMPSFTKSGATRSSTDEPRLGDEPPQAPACGAAGADRCSGKGTPQS